MRLKHVGEERLVGKTARSTPVGSRTITSKIGNRGRRVGRIPRLSTSPSTVAVMPGRSDAIG